MISQKSVRYLRRYTSFGLLLNGTGIGLKHPYVRSSCLRKGIFHLLKDEAWYRFNDETVEKMKGKKLELGTEEDPEGNIG